jgi:hypothetical protein
MVQKPDIEIDKSKRYLTGKFTPRHPEKYMGDVNNIIFRSSWELSAFRFLDGNRNVIHWCSECLPIPYPKPVSPHEDSRGWRPATYFPDIYVEYMDTSGKIIKEVVEIKPAKQTRASRSKNPKIKLQENYTYLVNETKWKYAKAWCSKRGITFRLATENDQFTKSVKGSK